MCTSMLNQVLKMNNTAVAFVAQSEQKLIDASTYLSKALDELASTNLDFVDDPTDFRDSRIHEYIKELQDLNLMDTGITRLEDSDCPIETKKQPDANKSLLLCKTNVCYDEGVQVFPDLIHLPVLERPRLQNVFATLFYNIGLLHMRQNNDGASLHFLKASYGTYKLGCNTNNAHEIYILHNVAYIHYRNKKFDIALDAFNKAYNLSCEVFGDESILVASALNCIGVTIFRMAEGEHKKALHFLLQSLAIRKKLLPAAHPDIATTWNNIGRVYFDSGDFAKAKDAYCEALVMRKHIFGEDHVDVAATTFNAGQAYHKLGRLDDAMDNYRVYFRIASKLLGRDHGDIAVVLKCIGQLYHEMKQNEKALKYYLDALETNRKAFGRHNREAASILNILGNLHYESGDFDRAIETYEQGLAVEKELMNHSHSDMVVTLSNIGHAFIQKGDYASALRKYTEVYFAQCAFSVSEESIAETLSMIGKISFTLGEYSQAQNAFLEVIRVRKDALGYHMDLALAHSYLGLVYFNQGLLDMAMVNFKESLRVRRMCRSEDSRDIAVLLYNIASIYLQQGDSEMALKFYEDTLDIEQATLGKYHSDVAGTLKIIGSVHDRCGMFEEAIRYYTRALGVLQKNLGELTSLHGSDNERVRENKLGIARLLAVIANVHLCRGNTDKMSEALIEAHRIYRSVDASASELELVGFDLYELSILHPECAPAA